ncbi:short-chain-enoyl-CoA hydratase [Clostridiaceae bacterium HSG29]|nr:short-chain-enoyl-CoA hydratase [Clostridiaceae bacterium HSG29]
MEYKGLLIEKKDNVAVLSFNRPKVLNALNSEVLKELDLAIDEIKNDNDIYVLIITGVGKAFVAGADISEMRDMNAEQGRMFAELGSKVFRKIELMEKPVIAAVNGFALGGGCELSMCCDIRIASEKAKFGQPEVGLGIPPGFAGTQRLSRLVGTAKAKELIFTGNMVKADEAYKIGLVNNVTEVDNLMDEAMKMATKIASNAQLAVRYSKTAINRGIETDFETGNEIEKVLFGISFATNDQVEGMTAFLEKRKPNFENK